MGNLPSSRTETAIVGAPVNPNLINEIQDVIISEHASRVATKTRKVAIFGPGATFSIDATVTTASGYQVQISPLVGETILAARAIIKDSATGPTKLQLTIGHNDPAGGTLVSGDATGSASSGSGSQQTISVSGSVLVASGKSYYLILTASTGSTNCHLYDLEYDYTPVT